MRLNVKTAWNGNAPAAQDMTFVHHRSRGSSRPFDDAELSAIAAFPARRIQRIAQGEFSDVSRAEMMAGFGFGTVKRRGRDAEVVA